MSRTNKIRTGRRWRKRSGGHSYRKNTAKTYHKRLGNKWGRQTTRQQLKKQRMKSQDLTQRELVRMDMLLARGKEAALKVLEEDEPKLPKKLQELHDVWSWD